MSKKTVSILAAIMAVLMVLSLLVGLLPRAYAVSQDEIDALKAQYAAK